MIYILVLSILWSDGEQTINVIETPDEKGCHMVAAIAMTELKFTMDDINNIEYICYPKKGE